MTGTLARGGAASATPAAADRPLRVLLLIDHLGSGGAQAILADIVDLAPRARFRFAVGYFFGSSMYTERLRGLGAEVVHLGAGGGKRTAWLHALLPWRVARLVRRFRPDVVHVHTHTLPVLHALLARRLRRRTRLVFTMHANLWQLGARWQRHLRRTVPRFDRVVTEFAGAAEEVAALDVPAARVRHIPFGARVREVPAERVAAVRAQCGAADGDLLLVSVARLSPDRLLDQFIQAMPAVLERHPRARLALVGDGTAEPELRALVRKLGLEAVVRFLGRAEDPMPFFHAADLYLTMSVAQSCDVGIAGWQAMLCGAPVLAIEPEPERGGAAVLACSHLHRVADPGSLGREIVGLLAEGARRARLAETGRRYALDHRSSHAMVAAYLHLYDELAAEASAAEPERA